VPLVSLAQTTRCSRYDERKLLAEFVVRTFRRRPYFAAQFAVGITVDDFDVLARTLDEGTGLNRVDCGHVV
jgi:hypothetical protein